MRSLEVEVVIVVTASGPAKRAATLINSPSHSLHHRRTRTLQQEEAVEQQVDRNEAIGICVNKLIKRWKCMDERCLNEGKFCFIAPFSDEHFSLNAVQTKAWATAIQYQQHDASLTQPPAPLYRSLIENQGSVGVSHKHPIAKQKRDQNKSMLEQLLDRSERMAEVSMTKELVNTLASSNQPVQQQQFQQTYPQFGPGGPYFQPYYGNPYEQHHFGPQQLQYSHVQQGYPQPPRQPQPNQPATPPLRDSPAPRALPPAPPSSPIAADHDEEDQVLDDYWDWKIRRTKNDQKKHMLASARTIVTQEM